MLDRITTHSGNTRATKIVARVKVNYAAYRRQDSGLWRLFRCQVDQMCILLVLFWLLFAGLYGILKSSFVVRKVFPNFCPHHSPGTLPKPRTGGDCKAFWVEARGGAVGAPGHFPGPGERSGLQTQENAHWNTHIRVFWREPRLATGKYPGKWTPIPPFDQKSHEQRIRCRESSS